MDCTCSARRRVRKWSSDRSMRRPCTRTLRCSEAVSALAISAPWFLTASFRLAGLRNRKKPQALPRHMTASEVERLILATPDLRHRAAFIAAYGAGLRVSETVSVKVGDIKPDRKCLHIPSGKGGAERMASLPDGVIH